MRFLSLYSSLLKYLEPLEALYIISETWQSCQHVSSTSILGLVCNYLLLIDGVLSRLREGWTQEVIFESVMFADDGCGRGLEYSLMIF